MASKLNPRITLLEGHDEGGPVNHGLQFLPRLILEKETNVILLLQTGVDRHTRDKSKALINQREGFFSAQTKALS